jgi:hypothetical protein
MRYVALLCDEFANFIVTPCRLKVFENRMLRRIFGLKRDK